jgi:hypothetical protein
MRHRRRTLIPITYLGQQIGRLQWNGEAMECWTAQGELIGEFPTRHEAASALWRATAERRQKIRERHAESQQIGGSDGCTN